MDLLAYAVNRKLKRAGDRLLDYVANGEDIPVSVLEESLGELLGPLDDNQSTMLVEDYPQMLERYVPVHYTKHPETGAYEVGGEISDRLLEAMELVHGRGRDEVISELIKNSTHSLTNSPTISVGELSLKQLSAQMTDLEESIPEMESFEDDGHLDEVFAEIDAELDEFTSDVPMDETNDISNQVVGSEEVEQEEVEQEEVEQEEVEQEEVEQEEVEQDEVEQEEVEQEEVEQEEVEQEEVEQEEVEQEEVEQEEVEQEEVVEDESEEISPEEYAEVEQRLMTEGIRRVYNKLVADLKAHGLDKELGLSI